MDQMHDIVAGARKIRRLVAGLGSRSPEDRHLRRACNQYQWYKFLRYLIKIEYGGGDLGKLDDNQFMSLPAATTAMAASRDAS